MWLIIGICVLVVSGIAMHLKNRADEKRWVNNLQHNTWERPQSTSYIVNEDNSWDETEDRDEEFDVYDLDQEEWDEYLETKRENRRLEKLLAEANANNRSHKRKIPLPVKMAGAAVVGYKIGKGIAKL